MRRKSVFPEASLLFCQGVVLKKVKNILPFFDVFLVTFEWFLGTILQFLRDVHFLGIPFSF